MLPFKLSSSYFKLWADLLLFCPLLSLFGQFLSLTIPQPLWAATELVLFSVLDGLRLGGLVAGLGIIIFGLWQFNFSYVSGHNRYTKCTRQIEKISKSSLVLTPPDFWRGGAPLATIWGPWIFWAVLWLNTGADDSRVERREERPRNNGANGTCAAQIHTSSVAYFVLYTWNL